MTFANPTWLWALLALPLFLLLRSKGFVGFSDSRLVGAASRFVRAVSAVPFSLSLLLLALVIVALARPQVPGPPVNRTIQGRDIVMAVDISTSMATPFEGELPEHAPPPGLEFKSRAGERRKGDEGFRVELKDDRQPARIDASQSAVLRFIENRWFRKTGDRIGLILFDERPRYGWPLTDDLKMIYRKAQFLTHGLGLSTNFGEHPPGPIDMAALHFRDVGQSKSRVLIMVTDGEDDLSGYTMRRLAEVLNQQDIRLYVVGIGETLASKDVDIIRLCDQVGGRVFRVENTQSLLECFATIDRLETSAISISELETRNDVYHWFVWAAVFVLSALLISEALILAR